MGAALSHECDECGRGRGPVDDFAGSVHMIVCTLDYSKTDHPLTTAQDGQNIKALAVSVGAQVEEIMNENATCAKVLKLIEKVGKRCRPGDYFIFYYAGHGTQLPDQNGDEESGKDQCLALVDDHGKTNKRTWLRDDDFSEAICQALHPDVNVIILADCCHSGTIADSQSKVWDGRQLASLSGCSDGQTSGDTGIGGIFTHSLLLACDRMKARGATFSLDALHKEIVQVDLNIFSMWKQDITYSTRGRKMMWPLPPKAGYRAPARKTFKEKADF